MSDARVNTPEDTDVTGAMDSLQLYKPSSSMNQSIVDFNHLKSKTNMKYNCLTVPSRSSSSINQSWFINGIQSINKKNRDSLIDGDQGEIPSESHLAATVYF